MDEFAVVHVSPFVVWPMPRCGILGAAAAGLAAQLHAFREGAGAQVIDGAHAVAYAGDASSGLLDDLFWAGRHGLDTW